MSEIPALPVGSAVLAHTRQEETVGRLRYFATEARTKVPLVFYAVHFG
mgnify:CR=1 FL=1